jgi:hypothetical protein
MTATEFAATPKRKVAAMVEKAVVIAIVNVSYEENEVRFDMMEVLFSSSPIEKKGTIYRIPRHEPSDLRKLNTLMFFPRFPPKGDDLVGFILEGDHLAGAVPTLTEVKEMIAKKRANQASEPTAPSGRGSS